MKTQRDVENICREVKNWFVGKIHVGEFEIKDGKMFLSLDGNTTPIDSFLRSGEYFRVVGSTFNDGVYTFSAEPYFEEDESFEGALWQMKPPTAFLELVEEIAAYNNTDAAKPSPYVSESFAGYSYQKISDYRGSVCTDWKSVFSKQLRRWRKI